ncbi:hypothetical protein J3A83DRAFT_1630541 [Scleroderma citrinum]
MTKVHERLLRAQQEMKDVIQPTGQEILTNRRRMPLVTPHYLAGIPIDANGKGIARSEDIIQAAQTAVDSMSGLVRWWAELIEMTSQLKEDAVRVVADLDSHDRAVRPTYTFSSSESIGQRNIMLVVKLCIMIIAISGVQVYDSITRKLLGCRRGWHLPKGQPRTIFFRHRIRSLYS